MLSIIYLDQGRFQFNPVAATVSPLERALQTARQAAQAEPGNTRALQALMNALFFTQQPEEAIRVGERALAINPNDTELMGEFGALLNLAGNGSGGLCCSTRPSPSIQAAEASTADLALLPPPCSGITDERSRRSGRRTCRNFRFFIWLRR